MTEAATPALARTAPPADRYGWMDLSRGLGVLLIVVVHAGSIFTEMSGINRPGWFTDLDLAFAPYRIPLLIFLSGILLSRSLAKGLPRYVHGKLRNLAWPFFLWTAVYVLAFSGPSGLLEIEPWLGGTTLWYMSFLGLYYVIGALFARVPYLVIAAYALAIAMIAPEESRYGSRLFLLMSYFFVGAYAGQHLDTFTAAIRSKWILALLPLTVGISVFLTGQSGMLKYSTALAPLMLAAIVCVCGVFNVLARGVIGSAFTFVGRNSIIYYVVHPPLYFVLFRLMMWLGVQSPYVAIFPAMAAAIVLATTLALLRPKVRAVALLFEAPDFRFGPFLTAALAWAERLVMPASATLSRPATQSAPAVRAETRQSDFHVKELNK